MASNGLQVGQEDAPAFPEEDALASGADLEEVSRYAKWRGNSIKGTTTQRNAWAAEYPTVEGVLWSDVTDHTVYVSTGSGGWERIFRRKTTFTPTFTNLTLGASTVTGWTQLSGAYCEGNVIVTLGAGFTMGSSPVLVLPVAASPVIDGFPVGDAIYQDTSVGHFVGQLLMDGSGNARLTRLPSGSSFWGAVDASNPFTWAAPDKLILPFKYPVA